MNKALDIFLAGLPVATAIMLSVVFIVIIIIKWSDLCVKNDWPTCVSVIPMLIIITIIFASFIGLGQAGGD